MTPAQRRKRLNNLKNKKKGFRKINKPLLVFGFFIVFIFLAFFFGKKNCFSDLNNVLVFVNKDGDVIVSSFNRKEKEVNSVFIPKNTQLEVSRQLGSWKVKSIWQLGVNEKYYGKLLQETVVKNFHFPVNIWADETASGFISNNFLKLLKATFFPYKSNLSLGDRLNLFFISFGLENKRNTFIDLSKTGVLKETRLTDGEEGYVIARDVPINVMAPFAEQIFKDGGYMIKIVNATGLRSVAENIGITLEAIGSKVVSIKEEAVTDFDCFISGKDKHFVKKISQIYSCEVKDNDFEGFDMVIKLGSGFSKRY